MNDDTSAKSQTGQWTYYALFILLAFTQASLAIFLDKVLAGWLGIGHYGAWFVWLMFILGGAGLGFLGIKLTKVGEELHGLFKVLSWVYDHTGWLGLCLLGGSWGGAMNVSIVLKKNDDPHMWIVTPATAVLYASIWIPFYLGVWSVL